MKSNNNDHVGKKAREHRIQVADQNGPFAGIIYPALHAIKSLTCKATNTITQDSVVNEDGSVTIKYPKFGNSFYCRHISASSHSHNVCMHFGYNKATKSEATKAQRRAVVFTDVGTFSFIQDGPVIASVTCT